MKNIPVLADCPCTLCYLCRLYYYHAYPCFYCHDLCNNLFPEYLLCFGAQSVHADCDDSALDCSVLGSDIVSALEAVTALDSMVLESPTMIIFVHNLQNFSQIMEISTLYGLMVHVVKVQTDISRCMTGTGIMN